MLLHAALWKWNKDWLVWSPDNVSALSNMSIRGLLIQYAIAMQIQLRWLV